MIRILVPLDGSDNALRAVRYAASLAQELSDARLELLNVQERLPPKVHAALSEKEIARWQSGYSDLVMQPARQILDAVQVPYQVGARVGSPANEIAQHVQDTQCDAIFMGTRGLGALANLVIGSVATKVIHLVQVPVTLVK
jgi:nucleotide-binding universal stress UspA family protein